MNHLEETSSLSNKGNSAPVFGGVWRLSQFSFFRSAVLTLLCLGFSAELRADTLSGTVKDPSGAVVAGAHIEITGESITQTIVLTSDESGKFAAPNLSPRKYSVRVTKDGFEPLISPVDLRGTSDLQLKLTIVELQTSVTVTDKSLAFANTDSIYRQLRDLSLGDTYVCEKFIFNMDVGNFELRSGTITFPSPVNGTVTGAIFVGQGHFTLKPLARPDIQEMERRSGHATTEEVFTQAVFRFTGRVYQQLKATLLTKKDAPPEATTAFQHWKNKVRHRREVPEGFTQEILEQETIDNVDADVLAAIYNPKHPQFFNAYMSRR